MKLWEEDHKQQEEEEKEGGRRLIECRNSLSFSLFYLLHNLTYLTHPPTHSPTYLSVYLSIICHHHHHHRPLWRISEESASATEGCVCVCVSVNKYVKCVGYPNTSNAGDEFTQVGSLLLLLLLLASYDYWSFCAFAIASSFPLDSAGPDGNMTGCWRVAVGGMTGCDGLDRRASADHVSQTPSSPTRMSHWTWAINSNVLIRKEETNQVTN